MPYMVSTSLNIHWAQRIVARSNGNVLKLEVYGDPAASGEQHNMAEITIFTEDSPLVERLVAAINGADRQKTES